MFNVYLSTDLCSRWARSRYDHMSTWAHEQTSEHIMKLLSITRVLLRDTIFPQDMASWYSELLESKKIFLPASRPQHNKSGIILTARGRSYFVTNVNAQILVAVVLQAERIWLDSQCTSRKYFHILRDHSIICIVRMSKLRTWPIWYVRYVKCS